ncbi:hypothetical protein A3C09_04775 [Candidatus Uhrbacteria bacterium RIFCSPHIGHO2_02_FULL_47_44]|uniref:Uncharacterized protein n=1 Tax=Candidatus Uhrbacteria bacterium RIFCSPLOWO2_02_FULL_48_18 TaxID=1802408 RepID=A0A1F7VCL4_9BACT|nr:MAG: hypothetical protein A2839_00950 [Candidatus Uhrbacteria bacterium RIFCSPHIGHO2_01_FULL_47_10]OGL71943.1 MAG: hypothetical protein A3C09_04775 [Candidatus Uhrbacteria bacterium RIFCSPHIGHO2_02_FULL_47_44]OGL76813.1 MAG: hypothetical protein A3E97_04535 [Candidatus Uhrbacteria bacterium RIFCSPHIGHO2_12_FULL_47_12]OGL80568.1 MAG: hypothetical protein A3B20_04170 [Candidatus Uhrbacteria bacterium RIFCSPLOWO2_01_FULL_47_17]OGL88249.1 MAG: hypothetical protein A3I41_00810 [Candidatus Uhrbact
MKKQTKARVRREFRGIILKRGVLLLSFYALSPKKAQKINGFEGILTQKYIKKFRFCQGKAREHTDI